MSDQKKSKFENPLTFLAASYPYLFLVILGIGIYYVRNLGQVNENSLPVRLFDSTTIVKEIPVSDPALLTAVDSGMIKKPTEALIAKGKELFNTNCVSCHGAGGKGDGVAGAAMNPKPRNFTAVDGWRNGREMNNMWKTLQEGIIANGMAPYDVIPADQRLGLIHYIRNTFMVDPPAITDAQLKEMDDKYQLTKGTFKPGTIPIVGAMDILSKSDAGNSKKLDEMVLNLNQKAKSEPGAKLFLSVAQDKKIALSFLLANPAWKENNEGLLKMVKENLAEAGFKYKLFALSADELAELHSFLKSNL
jgi:mono/diheme cytochrome c family protein